MTSQLVRSAVLKQRTVPNLVEHDGCEDSVGFNSQQLEEEIIERWNNAKTQRDMQGDLDTQVGDLTDANSRIKYF